MRLERSICLVCLTLAVLAIMPGCGGGNTIPVAAEITSSADFELTIVDETFVFDGKAAGFKCTQSDNGDAVELRIAVEDAANLKALMCELRYDPELYDPQPVECTGALDPAGGEVIDQTFALDTNPGYICYGQILPQPQTRDGFSGDATLAVARFLKQPDHAIKSTSTSPINRRSQTFLTWDAEGGDLSWHYCCSGDFNQDSSVDVADLTPIGQHWRETSGGGPFPDSDDTSVVDYDSNGEINFADIAGIVRNWGVVVNHYSVYTSQNAEEYPESGSDPNGISAVKLGTVNFSDWVLIPDHAKYYFEFAVADPQVDAYYWVRPVDYEDAEGTPSTLAGGPE